MYIGNKNVIPAISNLPGQGNPGAGPEPNLFLMALESALTDKVELE